MRAERNHSENHKEKNFGWVLRVNERWGGKRAFSAKETHSWDEGMWSLYWGVCERTDLVVQSWGDRGVGESLEESSEEGQWKSSSFSMANIMFILPYSSLPCVLQERFTFDGAYWTNYVEKKNQRALFLHTFLKEIRMGSSANISKFSNISHIKGFKIQARLCIT